MKKMLATVFAASLLTLPLTASADTNVKVTATIDPSVKIALNFDALDYRGEVGRPYNYPMGYKDGAEVYDTPAYTVSALQYYQLMVSSTDLVSKPTDGSEPLTLSSKRFEAEVENYSTPIKLTSSPTVLYSENGSKNNVKRYLNIRLNLEDNYYEYQDALGGILSQTQFESTMTFSLTGL